MTDAALQSIAAAYSTPTFVFDADALQARVRAIEEIFGPDIALCYSIKANPFCCTLCPPSPRGWKCAAPASFPSASSFMPPTPASSTLA